MTGMEGSGALEFQKTIETMNTRMTRIGMSGWLGMGVAAWMGLTALAGQAAVTGQWNFGAGNLSAAVGRDLAYFDGEGGATEQATRFGTTSDFGIPGLDGQAVPVIRVPKNSNAMGLVLYPDMAANGGGVLVNQYSLVLDLLFPAESAGRNRSILQTDDPFVNGTDAVLLVGASNGVGAGGGVTYGMVSTNQWYRLVATVDLVATPPEMVLYLDGNWVGRQVLSQGVDGRWAMSDNASGFGSDAALLFTDRNGLSETVYVSSLQVHDRALPPTYVAALGGATAAKIPATVKPRALVGALRPESGDLLVLPEAPLEVEIFEGDEPVPVESIRWTLDGQTIVPTVTRPSPGRIVLRHDPGLLAPSSRHTVSLEFRDPSVDALVNAGDWSFTLAPYNLPALDPAIGSMLYLPFDETDAVQGGEILDRSPEANHGVLRLAEGTADHKVPGVLGQAMDFKAEEFNYVELSKPWSALPNTFSVWLKVSPSIPDSTRVGVILGTFSAPNNINWELHTLGRPRIYWNGGTPDWNVSGFDFRTGEWEHLAFVRDPVSDTLKLYRNGRQVASRLGVGIDILPTVPSFVGADRRGESSPHFRGALDELVVYPRALSETEVWRLYARALDLPSYTFDLPQVIEVQPAEDAVRQPRTPFIEARIDEVNSRQPMDRSTATLALNGVVVPVTLQEEAGYVVLRHAPATPLVAGSTNRVVVSFQTQASPAQSVVREWTFTVAALPSITQQPTGKSVIVGASANFQVVAQVTLPVTYQWRRNGEPLPGATQATLILTDVQPDAAGIYSVAVTDAIGQVLSEEARLEVQGVLPADPAESLRIGLNAHWPFDGDFSSPVFGFDAVPRNGALISSNSRIGGGAVQFVQASQQSAGVTRAVIADNSLTYTAAGWFQVTGGEGRRFLWETSPANWAISTEITPAGTLKVFARNSNGVSRDLDTLIEATLGTWYHVAVVFDAVAGEAAIYLDGVRFAQPLLLEAGIGTGETTGFNLGTYRAADGRFFDGFLDDVAVWERALRDSEVAWLAAGNPVPAPRVSALDPIVIVEGPTETSGLLGSTVFLSVTATGTPPLTYQWTKDGAVVAGATSSTLAIGLQDAASGGRFRVVVSDAEKALESAEALVTVVPLPADPRESLGSGLTASWGFDGTFASSKPGFDGVAMRGASISADARVGTGSVQFSQAAQQYVDVDAQVVPDGTLTYSSAGWFRLGGGTGRRFLWETAPSNWAISAEISAAGNLQVFTRQAVLNSLSINTLLAPVAGAWHHLATVYDAIAGEVRVYVDGVRVAVPFPIERGVGTAPTTGFHLGSYRAGDNRFFEGNLDEVGVWTRLLAEAEIAYLAEGNPILSGGDPGGLEVTGIERNATGVKLDWRGGKPPYRVQHRAALGAGEWLNLAEGLSDTTFVDAEAGAAARFYRVQGTP